MGPGNIIGIGNERSISERDRIWRRKACAIKKPDEIMTSNMREYQELPGEIIVVV
jgi:hypothetical protein